ncbi:MAG: hypothetical protein M1826_005559, partial [Phylliscum demangeonii]
MQLSAPQLLLAASLLPSAVLSMSLPAAAGSESSSGEAAPPFLHPSLQARAIAPTKGAKPAARQPPISHPARLKFMERFPAGTKMSCGEIPSASTSENFHMVSLPQKYYGQGESGEEMNCGAVIQIVLAQSEVPSLLPQLRPVAWGRVWDFCDEDAVVASEDIWNELGLDLSRGVVPIDWSMPDLNKQAPEGHRKQSFRSLPAARHAARPVNFRQAMVEREDHRRIRMANR